MRKLYPAVQKRHPAVRLYINGVEQECCCNENLLPLRFRQTRTAALDSNGVDYQGFTYFSWLPNRCSTNRRENQSKYQR